MEEERVVAMAVEEWEGARAVGGREGARAVAVRVVDLEAG